MWSVVHRIKCVYCWRKVLGLVCSLFCTCGTTVLWTFSSTCNVEHYVTYSFVSKVSDCRSCDLYHWTTAGRENWYHAQPRWWPTSQPVPCSCNLRWQQSTYDKYTYQQFLIWQLQHSSLVSLRRPLLLLLLVTMIRQVVMRCRLVMKRQYNWLQWRQRVDLTMTSYSMVKNWLMNLIDDFQQLQPL